MKKLTIKKILIPIDFSHTALKALDHAVVLAKLTDAEISLVHIIETIHATTDPLFSALPRSESYETELTNISNESLQRVAQKITKQGVNKVNILSASGRTHKEIIRISKKIKADLIVMGTHGVSGFREFVMGSNTFRIVSDSQCPVLSVQKKSKAASFKTILVPFTAHPHSREKVMYAIRLAEIYDATLHILGIDDERTKVHSKKIALQGKQISQIVERHNLMCIVKTISAPFLAKTILNYAAKISADCVVTVGDEEKQNIAEFFTGSISQQIVNHSPIPVLSIHTQFNPDMVDLRFY